MSGARLAVSNLAWPAEALEEALPLLAAGGARGVEVAPTRIAPWEALEPGLLAAYRERLAAAGLVASSLQAVFFGVPQAQLLGDEAGFQAMAAHLRQVGMAGRALGAGIAVFGAPKNRNHAGDALPPGLLAERLGRLAPVAAEQGLVLAMEPVPLVYQSNVLTTWQQALEAVQAVDHPAVRLHLDTACVALGGGDMAQAVAAAGGWLAHAHAAQPQLADFAVPLPDHATAGAALRQAGYDGWIAIEMLQQPDWRGAVQGALAAVGRLYPVQGSV